MLGIPFLLVGIDQWQANRAWQAACAEADRLDPGWHWDELLAARPPVKDEENISITALAVRRLLQDDWPKWQSVIRPEDLPPPRVNLVPPIEGIPPPPPETLEERMQSYAHSFDLYLADGEPNRRLAPGQADILRRMLATTASANTLTDSLSKQLRGRYEFKYKSPLVLGAEMRPVSDVRTVARLLRMISVSQTENGDINGALLPCRAMLNIASPLADEPEMTRTLTAISIRSMAVGQVQRVFGQGEASPSALVELQRRLQEEASHPTLLNYLRGERAVVEDTVLAVSDGRLKREQLDHSFIESRKQVTGYSPVDSWLHHMRGGGWHLKYATEYFRYLTALIEAAKSSPEGFLQQSGTIASARPLSSEGFGVFYYAIDAVIPSERTSRALLLCASAALAVERFRIDRGGWPESFDELIPAYFDAAPVDSFNGQPLCFRRLADGAVIYSVGKDGVDDRGNLRADPETGLPAKDIGFRLWDPAFRRLPPVDPPRP